MSSIEGTHSNSNKIMLKYQYIKYDLQLLDILTASDVTNLYFIPLEGLSTTDILPLQMYTNSFIVFNVSDIK